jgi:hypothetical protein
LCFASTRFVIRVLTTACTDWRSHLILFGFEDRALLCAVTRHRQVRALSEGGKPRVAKRHAGHKARATSGF